MDWHRIPFKYSGAEDDDSILLVSGGHMKAAQDTGTVRFTKSLIAVAGLGTIPSVLFSEVSSFQRKNNTQMYYFGLQQLSSLSRCPYFRGS